MIDPYDDPLTLKEALAHQAVEELVPKVIRRLQELRGDHLQSGAATRLRDVWDEICVQVQYEHWASWPSHQQVIERIVLKQLSGLPPTSLHALWVQTTAGEQWLSDLEDEPPSSANSPVRPVVDLSYDEDDVVVYLRGRVINAAADWSNPRIERYLARR